MREDIELIAELVKKEAANLRENATKNELARLNFTSLLPNSKQKCVYGQMTGECNSRRATELITQCCKRVFENDYSLVDNIQAAPLNGSPVGKSRSSFWSPIEVFIIQHNNSLNNKELISYLKGEKYSLEFVFSE